MSEKRDHGEGGKRSMGRKTRALSVGGSFSHFSSWFGSVGVLSVTVCNWPVVTPELCKQISWETCQPEGLQVNVRVV